MLLRVPGIGPRGARLIVKARKTACLHETELRKLGIAYKRARFFITCNGKYAGAGVEFAPGALRAQLASPIDGGRHGRRAGKTCPGQMSLFDDEASRLEASKATTRNALAGLGQATSQRPKDAAHPSRAARKLPEKSQTGQEIDGAFGWQKALEREAVRCA